MSGKFAVLAMAAVATVAAHAFEEVPKESGKALGVTRGKPFEHGLVFVNGKYIEPPYVVERWGTGIRINSIPVTGQVIDWSEFVKTQDPAIVTKTMPDPVAEAPAPVQSYSPPSYQYQSQSDADALDDLFDDNPAPKKAAPPPRRVAAPKPRQASPRYELTGKFVKNEAAKALVKRINDQRTEIDGILRRGGFIFFGDNYSRVVGDSRTAESMLDVLPELMQREESVNSFRGAVRASGMVYINEIIAAQIFGNKIDYRRLQERRQKLKQEREWSKLLNGAGSTIL